MANRLSKETSPYLRQHQENPVDWYPWGVEALSRAKAENKPILLSIGYSACHWCHVMAHESFENPDIAQLMNEHFVSIKVDREERPDLDQIYQNVAQALTLGGGWPLTVFLTPDLKPFFGGTYFPPEDRYGRPGFPRLLHAIADAFKNDSAGVRENAEKLTDYIAQQEFVFRGRDQPISPESFRKLADDLLETVDWNEGGVGGAPKFPNSMVFTFLWRYGLAVGSDRAIAAVLLTLTRMASGGIYDQLGGGFHRYSVDGTWSVPHFEKMLYDNALLLKLYAEVVLRKDPCVDSHTKDLYLRILEEVTLYIGREMTSPAGGFYTAQDADSEGEEGKYFVWDREELSRILSSDEARIFFAHYGVTESGNFENAKTVLHLAQPLSEVAEGGEVSELQAKALLSAARAKLVTARSRRVAPGLDDKILTSWNALMISGLAWAAQALSQNGRMEAAKKAKLIAVRGYQFLLQNVVWDQFRLFNTFQGGQGKGNGYLDDYAFLALAALDLARFSPAGGEVETYLRQCQGWVEVILKHFKDPASPGYFFTSDDHEKLIQRPKPVFDQAIPSGMAVALTCMNVLAEIDWDGQGKRYEEEIESQLPTFLAAARKLPSGMGEMLNLGWMRTLGLINVSGSEAHTLCTHPHIFQTPSQPGQGSGKLLVCHRKTCSLPLEDRSQAEQIVNEKLRDSIIFS